MTAKCFLWVEPAIYRYLNLKAITLQLQNFLEFDFLRKCEKSVANLWECETGETQDKKVRLGKSVLN